MRRHAKGTSLLERPSPAKLEAPLRVIYPAQGETLAPPDYTFQIATAEDASEVSVCVNHGDWLPCREALGLWWFDWSGFEPAEYLLVARMRRPNGTYATSEPRLFFVK